MKYVPILALMLLAGVQIYTLTQLNRLTGILSATEGKIEALVKDMESASAELKLSIQENASEIISTNKKTVLASQKTASGFQKTTLRLDALEDRLNALEVDLRNEMTDKLTEDLVDAATSTAIEKVVVKHLPESDKFILELANVLAKNFQKELQGVPGEKVDPELLSTFLARDETFLDAMRFEILTKNTPIE